MNTLPLWTGGLQNVVEHPNVTLDQELQLVLPKYHIVAIDQQPTAPHAPATKIPLSHASAITERNNQHQRTVTVQLLSPPIIVSLRSDKTSDGNDYATRINTNNGKILSATEIAYLKNSGSNATLFIHGYKVAYGQFGPKADKITIDPTTLDLGQPGLFITGQGDATVYRDIDILRRYFPQIPATVTSINGDPDLEITLNGSEAHNWIIRMEDNLNCATKQFDHSNYLKFERLINITWSGDPLPINYVVAIQAISDPKLEPAQRLAQLIIELKTEGIAVINVIGHSLGCGLLIKAMDIVGKQSPQAISHAFLWQAAIPDNAFSRDANTHETGYYFDPTLDPWYVPHALNSAQKITVLYSNNDNTLGPIPPHQSNQIEIDQDKSVKELWSARALSPFGLSLYLLATWIGVPVDYFLHSYTRQQYYNTWISIYPRTKDGHYFSKSFATEVGYWVNKEYDHITQITDHLSRQHHSILETIAPCVDELFTLAKVIENSPYKPAAAMGYAGPALNTPPMQNLKATGKLITVDQTQWLWDHSGMRVPSAALMQNVYQKHVIGGDGSHDFGLYSISD